jgi:hypothetical protein
MEPNKEPVIAFIRDTLMSANFPISRQSLETIAEQYEPKSFVRNEFFVTEGKVNTHHFFMTAGFMRAFTHSPEREEVTTNFYRAQGPVFEADSIFSQKRSMENIQAITPCDGFLLSPHDPGEGIYGL